MLLFSHSGVSDSLRPHELQHARLSSPSLSPEVCSNSCPLSQWCYLNILSFATAFSVCLQSFPASGFSCGSAGKESACNEGNLGSIPGLQRSPGEGKGYPLQYSGLENFMDAIVHGVAKSWTRLSNFHFHLPSIRVFSNESALPIRWSNTGASASASVLPMNIQGWLPLGLTGLISGQSKGLSRVFHSTTAGKLALSLFYGPTLTSMHDFWENHSFDSNGQSDVSAF